MPSKLPADRRRAGFTTMELLVAATLGLVVTGAALGLLSAGNLLVATSLERREAWRHMVAAASLWSSEWRGAGYDPTGASGAGIVRLAPDTMEFSADWNADGAHLPTSANPNERLAWAAVPDAWKRGVNGGPRLPVAHPAVVGFAFRDSAGDDAGERPSAAAARVAAVRARLEAAVGALEVEWAVGRRNP